jgi:hypothetical protein
MKVKDMERLGILLRKDNVSDMSDIDICDLLVLSKMITDHIEAIIPAVRNEFIKRDIRGYIDLDRAIQVNEVEENNSSEIDVRQLFSRLNFDEFITLVKAVKSYAKSKEQKSAIELSTTIIEKKSKIVKTSKLSDKQAYLIGGTK